MHGLEASPASGSCATCRRASPSCLHAGEVDLGDDPLDRVRLRPLRDRARHRHRRAGGPCARCASSSRGPLERVRRVALDTSSRTSAALVASCSGSAWAGPRVRRHGAGPRPTCWPPPMPRSLIGDPALDLAEATLRGSTSERSGRGSPGCRSSMRSGRAAGGVVTPAGVRAAAGRRSPPGGLPCPTSRGATGGRRRRARDALRELPARRTSSTSWARREQEGLREFYRRAHALALVARGPGAEVPWPGPEDDHAGRSADGERLSREEGISAAPGGGPPGARRARGHGALAPPPRAASSPTSSTATSTTRTSALPSAPSARSTATCPRRRATCSRSSSSRGRSRRRWRSAAARSCCRAACTRTSGSSTTRSCSAG